MTKKENKMKTYEQGIEEETKRINDLIIDLGKELYVIVNFGKRRDRKKASIALATVASILQTIEETKE